MNNGSQDPKNKLKEAEIALAKAKLAVAEADKEQKLAAEFPKLGDAYKEGYPAIDANEKALEAYGKAEKAGFAELLGCDGLEAIKEEIEKADKQIEGAEKDLEVANTALDAAKKAEKEAVEKRDTRKGSFETLKKGLPPLATRHREADALRSEVDKEQKSGNYAIAYWLLTEKYEVKRTEEPRPVEPKDYEDKVKTRWGALSLAEAAVLDSEQKRKDAETAVTAAAAALATAKKDFDANLRDKLAKIRPPSKPTPCPEPSPEQYVETIEE